jgi:hypothetical protein
MLILETIGRIRRAFFVQGKSIKLICRELRVSRKVVRKVIRSEATEFRYEREAQPLHCDRHELQPKGSRSDARSLKQIRIRRRTGLLETPPLEATARRDAGSDPRQAGGRGPVQAV